MVVGEDAEAVVGAETAAAAGEEGGALAFPLVGIGGGALRALRPCTGADDLVALAVLD